MKHALLKMILAFGLSSPLMASSTFECFDVDLIKGNELLEAKGKLCSIVTGLQAVYGTSPLGTLSQVATEAHFSSKNHCKELKLEKANQVIEFERNDFLVESTGVRNTKYGSNALLVGKFLCVAETLRSQPISLREPL